MSTIEYEARMTEEHVTLAEEILYTLADELYEDGNEAVLVAAIVVAGILQTAGIREISVPVPDVGIITLRFEHAETLQ